MKPKRSLTITVLIVMLAIITGVVLNGCASIGKGKDADPQIESQGPMENQSAAVEQTGATSPGARTETVAFKSPAANTGSSNEAANAQARKAGSGTDEEGFRLNAAYLKQALERILPEKLPELNWTRIATILVGVLFILMIYGLAFGLARLPARRRVADRSAGGRQVEGHALG